MITMVGRDGRSKLVGLPNKGAVGRTEDGERHVGRSGKRQDSRLSRGNST